MIGISGDEAFEIRPEGDAVLTLRGDSGPRKRIVNPLRVSLSGDDRGGIAFEIALNGEDQQDLKIGLRYFEAEEDQENIRRFRVPLFRPLQGEVLRFRGALDPLDGLAPAPGRTRLEFVDSEIGFHMPTEAGHPGRLSPLAGARLVLATDSSFFLDEQTGDRERFYLVPEGDFEIRTPPTGGDDLTADEDDASPQSLVLGTAGTEVVRVTAGDVLAFQPGQPAFFKRTADNNVQLTADAGSSSPTNLMSSIGTTAWVTVRSRTTLTADASGPAPGYFAQPEDAPLYGAASEGNGLQYERIELASTGGVFFPILPPGDVREEDLQALRQRETEFVSPVRRHEILLGAAPVAAVADAGEVLRATTPQGLVGDLEGKDWKKLILAKTPKDGRLEDLAVDEADPAFSDALQRARVFIVCTDGRKLGTFSKKVTIADWQFDLLAALQSGEPAQPGGKRQFLLFKFHDRSLEELIDDPRSWSRADHFTPDVASVRDSLKQLIAETRAAHEAAGASSPYGKFLEVLTSPAWNGILALNAAINPAAMPEQVQCLLGGMRLDRFLAHHVGIEISRVNEEIVIQGSTLFGLIDYKNPDPDPPTDPSYQFHVPFLRVLFASSAIKTFDCTLRLTVNDLFDEATKLAGSSDNTLEFQGRYESHNGRDVYTFVHEQRHQFDLSSSRFLRSVTVTKLQFSTVDSRPEGNKRKVTSRFAFWGELAFQDLGAITGFDLLSFDALGFSDLGLIARFDIEGERVSSPAFEFDPGDLRLNVSVNKKRAGSLLDGFAMKLKSFLYSKRGFRPRDLGGFPIRLPRLSLPQPDSFRYGLAFELDLGSLGGLVSGRGGLKVDFLVGWGIGSGSPESRLYVALKLPESSGGKKEIGLQGVLRLIIEDFKLVTADETGRTLYALKLEKCALEVMGKRLPSEGGINLFIFADPSGGVPKAISTLGWFGTFAPEDPEGTFRLEFLGLGQRVGLDGGSSLATYQQVEDFLRKELPGEFDERKIKEFYKPDRGWSLAARMTVVDAFTLGMVFFDPTLYSMFLGVLPMEPEGTYAFTLEVNYRKVTEEIGVWSIDLGLPPEVRQMEFGAVSVTIPNLGLSIYTNGDFLIDVGFPRGLDFTRSFQAQALPFIGWGGFYFGKLSGATSTLLPGDFNTVIQAGLALRLGLGKEFSKGILRAGLSVTFYGILEGAAGYHQLQAGNPQALARPDGYALVGRFGVIGEVFGIVDFGIVKAGVFVRIDAGIGVQLAHVGPLLLWIDAGVSVRVVVVIGRIKTFFGTIKITITLRFEARVRFDWKIERGGALLSLAEAVEPLAWSRLLVPAAAVASRPDLPLFFVPEVTVVDGVAHSVAVLVLDAGEPFARLVRALAEWALRTHLELPDDGSDADVTVETLEALDARLNQARGLDDPTLGSETLDFDKLKTFLKERFRLTVGTAPDGPQISAVHFPILPDLLLQTAGRPGGDASVDFRTFTPCDEAYQEEIDLFFQKLWVNLKERQRSGDLPLALEEGPSMATLVFQEYFGFLIKSAVDRLWNQVVETGEPVKLSDLIAGLPVSEVGESASLFFRYGLRLPAGAGQSATEPFYRLLGQQLPVVAGATAPADFVLRLEKPAEADWFELAAGAPPEVRLLGPTLRDLQAVRVGTPDAARVTRIVPVEERPAAFAFEVRNPWTLRGGGELTLWTFPDALSGELVKAGSLTVDVKTGPVGRRFARETEVAEVPATDVQLVTRVDLAVKPPAPVAGGTPPAGIYVLTGMGEADRRFLDALMALPEIPAGMTLSLAYAAETGVGLVEHPVDPARVFLVRTNLSTETNPGQVFDVTAATPAARVHASLADAAAFGRLAWQSSLVNSGGYYLHAGNVELPDRLFQGGQVARVTLLFRSPAGAASFLSCHNALALDPTVGAAGLLFAETPGVLAPQRVLEPGCVGFRLERPRPARPLRVPPGLNHPGGPDARLTFEELEALLRTNGLQPGTPEWDRRLVEAGVYQEEIENLYSFLDYAVAEDAVFKASLDGLPVGPEPVDETWRYAQIVPVHNLAKREPEQPANRYATVGRQASLRFAWRDLFGNRGPASGLVALDHGYFDRLIPVSEWPGVVTSWDVQGTNGLAVSLVFDQKVYKERQSDRELIEDDLAQWTLIREQVQGPGAAVHVRSTLDGGRLHPLSPCGASPISLNEFLAQVEGFLGDLLGGRPTGDGPIVFKTCHVFDRAASPVVVSRELVVQLVVSRPESLLDPEVRARLQAEPEGRFREIREAVAPVPPPFIAAPGTAPETSQLEELARRFATAFAGLRLATGLGETGPRSLWMVAEAALEVRPAGGPAVTFAPRPLSLDLWSGEVEDVRDYGQDRDDSDGIVFTPIRKGAVDVDVDRSARSFLEGLEGLLAPEPAVSIRRVAAAELEALMAAKERLAEKLPDQVANVLAGQSPEGTSAAREAYRQKVRLSLRQGYDLDAIVHVPLAALPVAPERTRLYGRMVDRRTAGANGRPTFQLSVARVELPGEAAAAPALTFVLDSFQEEAQDALVLDLEFQITHVERGIEEQQRGEDGFETSNWLELVVPRNRSLGEQIVPIVLREYPQPPVLLGHTFQPESLAAEPDTLRSARSWRYLFGYQWPGASQDSLVATVEYNQGLNQDPSVDLDEADTIPQALVRFQLEFPHLRGILAGLPDAARAADAGASPGSPDGRRLRRVREALARVAGLAGRVADAFDQFLVAAALAEGTPRDVFRVGEKGGTPREIRLTPEPGEPGTRSMEKILIVPQDLQGQPLSFQTHEVSSTLRRITFQEPVDPEWRRREITILDLDVLRIENAWAGVQLERNADLVEGFITSPGFVFKTSPVRFGQPLRPALDRPERLPVDGGGTRTLREHLDRLFGELFGGLDVARTLRVECRYGFDIRGTFGSAGELPTTVPVRLFPVLSSQANPAEPIAAALQDWAARERPNRNGFFSLDVAVFNSEERSPVPLLRLRRLVLPLASIGGLP
ncbi:MAG TPA: hypothetical protein VE685_26010 [Thermoanaerobaculia bacterium]|nr:hypothetical protein [Thermoanaerobaculia bacterium]